MFECHVVEVIDSNLDRYLHHLGDWTGIEEEYHAAQLDECLIDRPDDTGGWEWESSKSR